MIGRTVSVWCGAHFATRFCKELIVFRTTFSSARFAAVGTQWDQIGEIGQVLYIGENTVKGHVKSILTKLDAIGRTEAIAIATRRGLNTNESVYGFLVV